MGSKAYRGFDAIYIVRPQVEKWTVEELKKNSNLESARKELERRLKVGEDNEEQEKMDRHQLREEIERAWWELDTKTVAGRKLMPSPKEHKMLLGNKEKYLLPILSLLIPKDKPPLLSDEEILNVIRDNASLPLEERRRCIAQAQRKLDIEHYENL